MTKSLLPRRSLILGLPAIILTRPILAQVLPSSNPPIGPGGNALLGPVGKSTSPPPPSAVTLDPANKGAAIALSGGNLTATNTAGTDATVKSTTSHSVGKFYFEVNCTAINRMLVGIGNASANLNNFVGSDANGIGYFGNGLFFVNGGTVGSGSGSYTGGNVVSVAVDLTAGQIWFRSSSDNNWNGSSSNNPATGVGGLSLSGSGVAAGPYFAALSPGNSSTTVTINFGATAYSQAVPSGFGNW